MNHKGLSIAVVGHANAGKTSLMRTLLRDSEFGEVADQAGTTRHVEGGAISVDGANHLALFDTPGLEDSIRLFAILKSFYKNQSVDGIERIQYFLQHLSEYPELEQEAKVLGALLKNDIIFYVIDLREPILGKYRDELKILSFATKPVIPVLNFTQQGQDNLNDWKKQLARLNFHAFVSFDNVHFKFSDELKIYRKMQTLLADQEAPLQNLIDQRKLEWDERFNLAKQMVAQLIVDCGALRYQCENAQIAIDEATRILQQRVRDAEGLCVTQLLKLYQFKQADLNDSQLPVKQGQWQLDLFSSDNLQELGIQLSSNMVKGAGLGVTIDLVTGGLTLGAAALTGGLAGALWGVKTRYYDEIQAKIKGSRYICLNDVTLQVLWLRQNKLLQVLQKRGHASFDKIDYQISDLIAKDDKNPALKDGLPEGWSSWLRQLHNHPEWSSLNNDSTQIETSKRTLLLEKISASI